MRLAPGWMPFTLPWPILGLLAFAYGAPDPLWMGVGLGAFLLAVGVGLFFRDPDREIGEGIVCPADGRIHIVEADRIATFLNVHNVHVIRAPYPGTVTHVERFKGPHLPAFLSGAKRNAGVAITLQTSWGEQRVELIAGLVARRAVAWVEPGEEVEKGQRIGLIKFGSRVDATLPDGAKPEVRKGQRVWAGASMLAKPPEGPA